MVEAQHRVSTLKLVNSVEEQAILEELIEESKPPRPTEEGFDHLHYLLSTPFRYPPLKYGSRYGARNRRGLFYGSTADRTVMAEVAFYRFFFLAASDAPLTHVETEHSLFEIEYRSKRGVDLVAPPFDAHCDALTSRTSYAETQALGDAMRDDGCDAFRFPSAREEGGVNVGIFSPSVFTRRVPLPSKIRNWVCTATPIQVIFRRRELMVNAEFVFPLDRFTIDGELPHPPT